MSRKPALTISGILTQLLGQKKWRHGIELAQIQLDWVEIVGPEIAGHTAPESLMRGRLLVHCDQDVWRTELGYLKPEMLKRIAEHVGEGVVKDVFLR